MTNDSVHVYPLASPHVTEGPHCWCEPRVCAVCPECDGKAPCWRCGSGGLLDTAPAVADADDDGAYIIIHNDR